jgi:hypothetical protein
MKKIKFEGKLSLNKETVSKLNEGQMNQINGGGTAWLWTLINCATKQVGCPNSLQTCPSAGVTCDSCPKPTEGCTVY